MYIKKLFFFFFLIFGNFIFLLWLNNSTTLIIQIHEENNASIKPKIYYTYTNHLYSEDRSISFTKVKNKKYYFDLPSNWNDIHFLRLDPDTKSNRKIIITNITLFENSWFKKNIYIHSLKKFIALNQVSNLKIDHNQLKFITKGNDPFIETAFQPKQIKSYTTYHIKDLFIAILLAIIMYYLYYHVYKYNEFNEYLQAKLILYILFGTFIVFQGIYYKSKVNFGYPPDEKAHYTYVQYVKKHHDFLIKFEELPTYLSHPPLYYELENILYDSTASKETNIDNYRSMSLILFTLSLLLLLYLGYSSSLSILGDFIYLTVIASIPMFPYIGASISNDNLAFVGAAIFLIGLYHLIQDKTPLISWGLIALGGLIAYFSKLTAALLVFFALLYYLTYKFLKKETLKLNKFSLLLLFLALLPIIIYQGYIFIHYHSIIPTYNLTHPEAYLHSNFYIEEQYRPHLTLSQWFQKMLHMIHSGWLNIHSHHCFGQANLQELSGIISLYVLSLLSLFLPCKEEKNSLCILGKITLFSLFTVLIIQFFFSYKAHLKSGYLGGLQPRYVLPFLVGFAIMASLFVERFKKSFFMTIIFIIIALQALYSDFFYFLLYYR